MWDSCDLEKLCVSSCALNFILIFTSLICGFSFFFKSLYFINVITKKEKKEENNRDT